MKYLIYFLVPFLSITATWSQNNSKDCELDFFDLFVVNVEVKKKILSAKDYCLYKNGTKCNLYEVVIKEVLYIPKNTVADSSSLMNLKYIIVPVNLSTFNSNSCYLVTLRPASNISYMGVSRLLSNNVDNEFKFFHRQAYISGLLNCNRTKRDSFLKYITINQ